MRIPVRCPAARPIEGATTATGGVICDVMELAAPKSDQVTEGETAGRFLQLSEDPSTVAGFCCGPDDPPLGPKAIAAELAETGRRRRHYLACPTWQAELERIEARRDALLKVPERPELLQTEAPAPALVEELTS